MFVNNESQNLQAFMILHCMGNYNCKNLNSYVKDAKKILLRMKAFDLLTTFTLEE